MDDPEPPFHGPGEVVRFAEVAVILGVDVAGQEQGVEGFPQVRMGGFEAVGVAELEVLDQELDVGQAAEPSLEVVRPPRVLQLASHRHDLAGQGRRVERHGQARAERGLDLAAEAPRAWITRARVRASRSQTCAGPRK